MKNIYKYLLGAAVITFGLTSCNAFLDREPLDKVSPESYFNGVADLEAYTIGQYHFASYDGLGMGYVDDDNHTDNQVATQSSNGRWVPGEKRVPEKGAGLAIGNIRNINWFFKYVLPKFEEGKIMGDSKLIAHLIGEAYFLRAYNYFAKLQAYGDFPIITEVLPDDKEVLIENAKRSPRNEVARFILSDLDKAIDMMMDQTPYGKNRLSRKVALQFKSRVALYEASWLTYHKGTDRVPGGEGWPGAAMDYNANFSIDLQKEIDFFLSEAMSSAKQVADAVKLVPSTETVNPAANEPYGWNPYFEMFCTLNSANIDEILMARSYNLEFKVSHSMSSWLAGQGGDISYSRNMIESFLMRNGLPIYDGASGYQGDLTIEKVKQDRDLRLQLFVAAPTDIKRFAPDGVGEPQTYKIPNILAADHKVPSGYGCRKFMSYDPAQVNVGVGSFNTYECILFRAAESYLNYIEACYMKNGNLDSDAMKYWKALRRRAGVSDNIENTIAHTDLSKESDWAVYSAGQKVDKTLYNIRRERRLELMSEGFRMDDLKRWCALDQVKNYQMEGINLWGGEMEKLFEAGAEEGDKLIPFGTPGKIANVSSKAISGTYLRPYQINQTNNLLWDGYTWSTANYLEPFPFMDFQLTEKETGNLASSPLYQNPGWLVEAGAPATK